MIGVSSHHKPAAWLTGSLGTMALAKAAVSLPSRRAARRPLRIAILSYDRPEYLRYMLLSLRRQLRPADRVTLFQDGARNPYSKKLKADPDRIDACVGLFRQILPHGKVIRSPTNLGIAANYERAENHIFGERQAPYALFLEDDLILSPHYLNAVDALLRLAQQDERIAYVAAYGDLFSGLSTQWKNRDRLIPMHENWGFAMTRRAWQDERPYRRRYLALLEGTDYSERDHDRIRDLFREWGFDTRVTSQDAARWLASLYLGKVRVTTSACYAHYIGLFGEHARPDYYFSSGFHRTIMAPWLPAPAYEMTDDEFEGWLGVEQARFSEAPQRVVYDSYQS